MSYKKNFKEIKDCRYCHWFHDETTDAEGAPNYNVVEFRDGAEPIYLCKKSGEYIDEDSVRRWNRLKDLTEERIRFSTRLDEQDDETPYEEREYTAQNSHQVAHVSRELIAKNVDRKEDCLEKASCCGNWYPERQYEYDQAHNKSQFKFVGGKLVRGDGSAVEVKAAAPKAPTKPVTPAGTTSFKFENGKLVKA
jgi:hypothetical protein